MFGARIVLLLISLVFATQTWAAGKPGYFLVRPDMRRCAAPQCGGFFLRAVNVDEFECPSGSSIASQQGSNFTECYVSEIRGELMGPSVTMVRGSFKSGESAFVGDDFFEGKLHPHPAKITDAFATVWNVGGACAEKPCLPIHASKLNAPSYSTDLLRFASVDLSRFPASEAAVRHEMRVGGVVVSASLYAEGGAVGLRVSNFFSKLGPKPVPCKKPTDCSKDDVCDRVHCEEEFGLCKPRPSSCTREYKPVCACNGARQFDNDCIRRLLGAPAANEGACPEQPPAA